MPGQGQLQIRVTVAEKDAFRRAALRSGQTISTWIRAMARVEATRILGADAVNLDGPRREFAPATIPVQVILPGPYVHPDVTGAENYIGRPGEEASLIVAAATTAGVSRETLSPVRTPADEIENLQLPQTGIEDQPTPPFTDEE